MRDLEKQIWIRVKKEYMAYSIKYVGSIFSAPLQLKLIHQINIKSVREGKCKFQGKVIAENKGPSLRIEQNQF